MIADVDDDDSLIERNANMVQKTRIGKQVLSMIPEDQEDKINSMTDCLGSFPSKTEKQRNDSSNPQSISNDFNQSDVSPAQQKTRKSTLKFDHLNSNNNLETIDEKLKFEN